MTCQVPTRHWSNDTRPEVVVPALEVVARIAAEGEAPSAARLWVKRAELAGWTSRVTYARGTKVNAKGEPQHLIHNVAVRLARVVDDVTYRAVVVYEAKAFHGCRYPLAENEPAPVCDGSHVEHFGCRAYIEPAAAKWTVDIAYAWTKGVEIPQLIGLSRGKTTSPDVDVLGEWLAKPSPRRPPVVKPTPERKPATRKSRVAA